MKDNKITFEEALAELNKLYKIKKPKYNAPEYVLTDKDGFLLDDIFEAMIDIRCDMRATDYNDLLGLHGMYADSNEEAQEWYLDYTRAYDHLLNDLHITKDNAPYDTEFLKLYCDELTQAMYKADFMQNGLINSWDDDYRCCYL